MTTERADLVDRIHHLDEEITRLWRQLGELDDETASGSALEITAAGQGFLLPIEPIREVIEMVWPQPLPDAPDWVMGAFRFGDHTVPMVDLGRRLAGQDSELREDLSLIVLEEPLWLALVVDDVGDVVEIDPAALSAPHPGIAQARFLLASLEGDDGGVRHLISVGRLVDELGDGPA